MKIKVPPAYPPDSKVIAAQGYSERCRGILKGEPGNKGNIYSQV